MSQVDKIKELLEKNEWVCSNDILQSMMIVDYRARITDLKREGLKITSEPCKNRCGRKHTSNMHRYKLEKSYPQPQPPVNSMFEMPVKRAINVDYFRG